MDAIFKLFRRLTTRRKRVQVDDLASQIKLSIADAERRVDAVLERLAAHDPQRKAP